MHCSGWGFERISTSAFKVTTPDGVHVGTVLQVRLESNGRLGALLQLARLPARRHRAYSAREWRSDLLGQAYRRRHGASEAHGLDGDYQESLE